MLRKILADSLKDEKAKLSELLSQWTSEFSDVISSGNCIYVCLLDQNGDILFINSTFNDLIKGKGSKSFLHPSSKALAAMVGDGLLFEGFLTIGDNNSLNRSIEVKVYRRENELLMLGGINANDLFEQNEKVFELNAENQNLQRDLIKEKKLLQSAMHELNQTNEELSKRVKEREKFLSLLVHDIKSPFNSLLGFTYLLANKIEDFPITELKRLAKRVHNITEKSDHLLNDIITWYKAQSGRITFTPEEIYLEDFCREIVKNVEYSAQRKEIQLGIRVNEAITFRADLNMLKTILRNLLANAIKFTHEKGKVVLQTKVHGDRLIFEVEDTGVGISQDNIDKIMDESVSYTTEGAGGESGTGIGVNLCIDLIRKSGGQLHIYSQPQQGSTFWFDIPLSLE
jgi:signal transduction histidine kinase